MQTRCIVKGEAQKNPLFWRFSGGFWFSQDRLFSRNSTRKPFIRLLNLIKSPIFTNTPCKTACLYNAPSMHTLDTLMVFSDGFFWGNLASWRGGGWKGGWRGVGEGLGRGWGGVGEGLERALSWFSGRRWGQQLFSFQSPAVQWMARTSSLNCLSCRNDHQAPHSLNCLPPFHRKKYLFFSLKSASSHSLPKSRLLPPRPPFSQMSRCARFVSRPASDSNR